MLYLEALLQDVRHILGDAFPLLSGMPGATSAPENTSEHGPADVGAALLQIADQCVQGRAPISGGHTADRRLASIFSRAVIQRAGTTAVAVSAGYLEPRVLSTSRESLFPIKVPDKSSPETVLSRLFGEMQGEIGLITDEASLFALLEKYLVTVPTEGGIQAGSLFDQARARAAVALCLFDEHEWGAWKGAEQEIRAGAVDDLPAPCLLVSGGLSGIQDFIFDVPSRRASKSLKGRSAYVQFATDACVLKLVDALDLRSASVLYNGGGSFILLAPASRAQQLEELRSELGAALLSESLALALGWAQVSVSDFREARFGGRWQAAHVAMQRRKERRFQELGAAAVFTPVRQRVRDDEGEDDPFARLTEQLSRAVGYAVDHCPPAADVREGAVERRLGLDRRFVREAADASATIFNRTDFVGAFRDFRFAVKDLPRYSAELLERLYPDADPPEGTAAGTLIHFQDLARMAKERTGTEKLGVLKMDVDDLGEIFARGLPESERTMVGVAALSRSLKWFFEGYVNEILARGTFRYVTSRGFVEAPFGTQIYPIFSGGDDFLVVGAWDAVFEFARRVHKEFAEFVGHHPGVTVSASLLVVDPKESVVRFAARADERLEDAKLAGPEKDRISVFDSVLRWRDFATAAELKERLEVLVKQRGESQNLLQRVQQSAAGHERFQMAARAGSFRPERIWRLAYFLGRTTRKENREEIDRIAKYHQELLLAAFVRPQDPANPALFMVAGRWAELSARQGSAEGQHQPAPLTA
jgi:CRISPR-associated protein Csm1